MPLHARRSLLFPFDKGLSDRAQPVNFLLKIFPGFALALKPELSQGLAQLLDTSAATA